jgi:hypothetical protein
MNLFAIYIGGEHPGAHIEVHDVRFVVAPTIKDTHDRLRADWWGTPGTLHVDCWAAIDHADGYDVALLPEPSGQREKLWFVNLGGYDQRDFAEQHRNMFVVAISLSDAKARAMATVTGWKDAHRDEIYEADQVFDLGTLIGGPLHIHLTKTDTVRPLQFTCRYTPLK